MFLADFSLSALINALKPQGVTEFFGIIIYVVILLDIAALVLTKESNLLLTVLLAASILFGIILEMSINDPNHILSNGLGSFRVFMQAIPETIENFFLGVIMFLGPLVVAGMTRTPRARLPAVLGAIAAGVYVFGFWLTYGQ